MGRSHRRDSDDAHHHHRHHYDHDHYHGHDHHHGHDHVYLADPGDVSHGDRSGYETGAEHVTTLEDIFGENDHRIGHNRGLPADYGVEAINLMNSPSPGKTALLEKALAAVQGKLRVDITEGDVEAALDANRLKGYGAQIPLLSTDNGFSDECYLDALMVSRTLEGLDLSTLDLTMIENMGDLVCLAEFKVSGTCKAVAYPPIEGGDKSVEYPVMLHSMQVVVINRMNLVPHPNFDMELFRTNLEKVNPGVKMIEVSTKTGEGIDEWLHWINPAPVD